MSVRQNWSQDRVLFLDERGVQRSLPVEWTDAVDPDVFVAMAAGRSALRVADLLVLAGLVDSLRSGGQPM